MQKIIYHIHNEICKHSSNKLDEIVSYSLKHGYKELFFTEHPPVPINKFYLNRRPNYDEIKNLKHNIDLINEKYKKKLHIYFGYEIEFGKADRSYMKKYKNDPYPEFLIFGNHFYGCVVNKENLPAPLVMYNTKTTKQLDEFNENNKAAMSSKLFSWVAHPEIFLYSYRKWDKFSQNVCQNIIKWSIKYKLPLAFNVNFSSWQTKDEWHYPCKYFWQMVAKTNIPVIIESDSHDIHTLKVNWLNKARKFAISCGLEKNLKEKIKINWLKKSRK